MIYQKTFAARNPRYLILNLKTKISSSRTIFLYSHTNKFLSRIPEKCCHSFLNRSRLLLNKNFKCCKFILTNGNIEKLSASVITYLKVNTPTTPRNFAATVTRWDTSIHVKYFYSFPMVTGGKLRRVMNFQPRYLQFPCLNTIHILTSTHQNVYPVCTKSPRLV